MEAEQVQWASQLREIPIRFRQALRTEDDRAIRHHPAMGEWSAIEVLGHMIDKMALWSSRIERIWQEERPSLPDYDQDAGVHDQGYQQADPAVLCEHLEHRCERFAALVAALPASALQREGVHGVFGPMTSGNAFRLPWSQPPSTWHSSAPLKRLLLPSVLRELYLVRLR